MTPAKTRAKNLLVALFVMSSLALGACTNEEEAPATTATSSPRVPDLLSSSGAEDGLHVQARWEEVTRLEGTGSSTTRAFDIAEDAIQWRVAWSCGGSGPIEIRSAGLADDEEALVQAGCPASGEGSAIETGTQSLNVQSSGEWSLRIEQQVDTPLYEPLLEEMQSSKAEVISRSDFYDVELTGTGKVLLYELPNGRLVVRLEDFWVTPNIDLEVWTSVLEHPRTSEQLVENKHREIEFLRATAGSQNYLLPPDMDRSDVGSIAIWCELTHQIYVASEA